MKTLIHYILEATGLDEIKLYSSDYEIIIALSCNLKSLNDKSEDSLKYSDKNIEKSLMFALFGPKYFDKTIKDLSKDQKTRYDKFFNYYNSNKNEVHLYAESIDVEKGNLYTKLNDNFVSNDISNNWIENGNYNKKSPNKTPKTDVICYKKDKNGSYTEIIDKFSVKKSSGAQAMSGGVNEAMATLLSHIDLLNDENKNKIISLFKDKDNNDIDWSGKDKERNQKLTKILREVMTDTKNNGKFIIAVITEAMTGSGKFNKDSNAIPSKILTWTKGNKLIIDDIKTYILKTYIEMKNSMFIISTKSNSETSGARAALRLNLPKHLESYKLSKEEEKEFKDLLEVIDNIYKDHDKLVSINIDDIKYTDEDEKELEDSEVELSDNEKISVKILTGPDGGLYYKNSNGNKTYVKKKGNHYILANKNN